MGSSASSNSATLMSTCWSPAWNGRPRSLTSSTGACVGPGPRSRSSCPGSTRWPSMRPAMTQEVSVMSEDGAPGRGSAGSAGSHGTDRVYFRQLLSGRDFARGDTMARQMVNFVYLIGDRETGEAMAVDPAYAVQDLLDIVAADDMRLTGVLGTHFHPDHLGGNMGQWSLEGISTLLEKVQVPIHVQAEEVPWVERTTGVGGDDLVAHHSGGVVQMGQVSVAMIHPPGHAPGSECFLVDGRLVAGDTLFLEGCGRTDF